ncbi:MAG: inositol 2-dehydrogenase [Cobetia sp.]|jgi:myo-inositol 2-dehydrogenase/D-chiro-inositol 1-dehydrogenase|uniref:inositol 2-dehydrogenase n=1 Tax=Cobetia TaxID=204286 RepID=UPI001C053D2C|nr:MULTISPECIES: inositol 2-dehydrogenase [Cobetia]MDH2293491.1 inositol 2-dehydrogenase [Cobetia sp. 1AS1]QWN38176.1 inositol 2-dehydrogenase [Cobetia sp. 4B]UBU49985.1 inositol 2-dehydrogenase [Cobetia amphilecti]
MKIALLGAGRIGRVHARAISDHPTAELASVSDAFSAAAESLASEYGVPVLSADDVFSSDDIDGVLIASSTPTHSDFLERAARSGKAVLCEKPIDLDLVRTRHCLAVLEEYPVTCALGFNRRHDPQFSALKTAMDSGRIGKLEMITITSRDPEPPPAEYIAASGGIFRDMSIHDLDMAAWLLGEPVTEVTVSGSCLVDPAIGEAGDLDSVLINLKSASGKLVNISNSRRACYGYDQRIEVFGSKGMLEARNETDTQLRFTGAEGVVDERPQWFFLERYSRAYAQEVADFVAAWQENRAPLAGAQDGLAALELAEAALISYREGRRVLLSEIR